MTSQESSSGRFSFKWIAENRELRINPESLSREAALDNILSIS